MTALACTGMMAVFKNMKARSADKAQRVFCKILGDLGLKINVQRNMKIVNFLDVTLNLSTGKYYPFRKPDNNPLYINAKSNHPPSIVRQIPASISTRVSSLSCDSMEFDKTSQLYNDALRSSETIQYEENWQTRAEKKNQTRSRNIIWFNPPFSQNVQTNVAKSFLRLIDKHFPKSHKLHKIFNRNKLKESYNCTTNIANIIKNHNKKILNECEMTDNRKRCNAKTRTFALLVENVSQIKSSTEPQSQQHLELQVTTSARREMTSKQDSITTNSLLGTKTTHMTQFFQNTSGN